MPRTPRKMQNPKGKPNAIALSGQADDAIKTINYIGKNGHNHIREWLDEMPDEKAHAAILHRLARVSAGNFGDHGFLRDGVWELRIDVGPGYRVYYAKTDLTVVLLLCGGDKRRQKSDIDQACDFWREWKQRKGKK